MILVVVINAPGRAYFCFFFKQKTAYAVRISDWSSDVCSSDLLEPSLGLVYGGAVGPGRLLVGLNLQGRHNPKKKSSLRYGDSPENDPDFAVNEFDNREDQRDTRERTEEGRVGKKCGSTCRSRGEQYH